MTSLAEIARCTLAMGEQGVVVRVQDRGSHPAVAEYQGITSPRMRVRHFNIAGIAWSNFKPGININAPTPISN